MHPAFSVIVFTTASGAGYGLLALAGSLATLGLVPADRWLGLAVMGLALALVTFGLLSSTAHLGHPERAWRAVTQWRSSWLSREGVLALATYVPAGLFALGWVFYGRTGEAWSVAGLLAALLAAATVYATGMIYATLPAIPRWHNRWVVPVYLGFALMTGALWLNALLRVFGQSAAWALVLALVTVPLAWALKGAYWRSIAAAKPVGTAASATGLGALGRVRLLDMPHTEENYLLKEMGYRVARKHAARLRRIAVLAGFVLPVLLLLPALALPGWAAALLSLLAALSAMLGVAIERWLFFAEAKHTVTLYYGAETV